MQNDNKRVICAADSSIYILNNLSCPAILVECGFLSNATDVRNLKDPHYQQGICLVIATGVLASRVDK